MEELRMDEVPRLYYQVGDVARAFNEAPSCIRYWMKEFGLEPDVKRGHSGARKITATQFNELKEIHHLMRVEKYTLAGALEKRMSGVPMKVIHNSTKLPTVEGTK